MSSPTRRCRELARRLLYLIDEKGQTLEVTSRKKKCRR